MRKQERSETRRQKRQDRGDRGEKEREGERSEERHERDVGRREKIERERKMTPQHSAGRAESSAQTLDDIRTGVPASLGISSGSEKYVGVRSG